MSKENPRWVTKLIATGAIAIGFGIGGAFAGHVAYKEIAQDYKLPDNAVEASEDFLMLQQSIMSRLGSESYIKTPPNQFGQEFNVGERRYTFLLDKEVPNIKGYKRTLIIERGKEGLHKEEYVLYNGKVVYKQVTSSITEPLDVDEINQLVGDLKMDFEEWQRQQMR